MYQLKIRNCAFFLAMLLCIGVINSVQSQSYYVSGTITDNSTGLPVEGASIQISDPVSGQVYASGISSDSLGNYETLITIGATDVHHDVSPHQKGFKVTGIFPNPVQLTADLNIYYIGQDDNTFDPVVELYDINGAPIEVHNKLEAGIYSFRLSYQNGTKSNSQKLIIPESGYLKYNLIRNNTAKEVAHTKSTDAQLAVKFTIEKSSYEIIVEEKSLSSESTNTVDFTLYGIEALLSPAMRILVLDSIESKLNQLIGVGFAEGNQLMLEFLAGLNEVEDATIDEYGSITTRFIDGKLIYIASSQYPFGIDTVSKSASFNSAKSNSTGSGIHAPSIKHDQVMVNGSGMLPSSRNFRLLNGLNSYYDNTNPIAKIRPILTSKGYIDAGGDATLESLRNVGGDGIFYYRTHGDQLPAQNGIPIYALWTSSPVEETAEAEDTALIGDLNALRIIYMFFRDAGWQVTESLYSKHYGITHRFISHYMTFSPNALVYIDACNSSVLQFFRNSFSGASLFVGWNNFARFDKILVSSQYVFDRLLGANMFDIPDPPQRPFEYSALTSDPDFGPNKKYGFSPNPNSVANLGFFRLRDDFAMLAPSIKNFEIDEVAGTMEINGKFGPDPGPGNRAIVIGERNVEPNPWTDGKITVELKPEDKGEVVVKINDIESNKVPLTGWKGELVYTYRTFNPTLTQEVNCEMHFRGDVHPYRDLPGGPLQYMNIPFVAARDSKGNWNYSGREEAGDGCSFTEISGSGTVEWVEPGNAEAWNGGNCEKPAQYIFKGTIDPKQKKLTSNLILWVCGDFNFAYRINESCMIQSVDEPLIVHPDYLLAPIDLSMDDVFNIESGSRGEINGDQEVKLEWKNFITTLPPNDNTPSK